MSDQHVLYAFNRDWGFADSKKEFRFNFRKCSVLLRLQVLKSKHYLVFIVMSAQFIIKFWHG